MAAYGAFAPDGSFKWESFSHIGMTDERSSARFGMAISGNSPPKRGQY